MVASKKQSLWAFWERGKHLSCSVSLNRLAQSIPGAPVLHREGTNAAPFTDEHATRPLDDASVRDRRAADCKPGPGEESSGTVVGRQQARRSRLRWMPLQKLALDD